MMPSVPMTEPLQEQASQAAVDGKSLLAIFPTGGGKSLTFQLPALMDGRTIHGLDVYKRQAEPQTAGREEEAL